MASVRFFENMRSKHALVSFGWSQKVLCYAQRMQDLKMYSDADLLNKTKSLVEHERLTTIALIECLTEVEVRMLYATLGFSSLWEFCLKYLSLSEGASMRRIQAMRLTRRVPEVKAAIADGTVSLSNAAKLEGFIKSEKKNGRAQSLDQQVKAVEQIKGLTQAECEKKLFQMSPQYELAQKEVLKPVATDQNLLKTVLTSKTVEQLNLLRDRLAHRLPNASYTDLIAYLVEDKLNQIEKKMKPRGEKTPDPIPDPIMEQQSAAVAAVSSEKSNSSTSKRKAIPIAIERRLWKRSGERCEYVSPEGQRCLGTHALEIEHRIPVAAGGTNDIQNLLILCRCHNQLSAKNFFGDHMAQYIPSLKR